MPLLETLSPAGQSRLEKLLEPGEELLLAVKSDVEKEGRYGEPWLLMTPKRLLVFPTEPNGVAPEIEVKMESVTAVRAEGLVGNGVLEATVEGRNVSLLRYSNSLAKKFAAVAKTVEEYAKEKKFVDHAQEEDEQKVVCDKCGSVLPEWSEGICPKCMNKRQTVLRILAYGTEYKGVFAAILVMMVIGTAADVAAPYINKILIDQVFNFNLRMTMPERFRLLFLCVGAIAGLHLLSSLLMAYRGYLIARTGSMVTSKIREDVFRYLQTLQLKFFDKKMSGNLISRVGNDTREMHWLVVEMIPEILMGTLYVVGVGTVLFLTNWRLALIALMPIPLILFFSIVVFGRARRIWRRGWHSWGKLFEVMNNSLTGIRVVKAFAQEPREVRHFRQRNDQVLETTIKSSAIESFVWPGMELCMATGGWLVWLFGGAMILNSVGGGTGVKATLGDLFAFMGLMWMFYGNIQWLPRMNDWVGRALTAAERVFEILNSTPETYDAPDAVDMPRFAGRIEFINVTFGYDKLKPVLKNVDLVVEPGDMIGLVGHSGAGKSTMINLLCRFYEVDEGQILIDGVDIRKIKLKDLRSQIGLVPQDSLLFAGTIADNIAYGKEEASREEVIRAALAANAHDFIMRMPDGYDTQVGERGGKLSGGERQRIAIARAILHDPRILILDEATASVDTETERQIQEALGRLIQNRTTVAIAHRLSTLRNAKNLLVLDQGKRVEFGTHDELLEKDGVFARLVSRRKTSVSQSETDRGDPW
ncbi:MAG: ABC transporter ATP-binding protein/permease, partial [Armatimonadetes bacterium]|nr:ABC transporter ATP-binding protein/permease [Armatimonadota bacterium]